MQLPRIAVLIGTRPGIVKMAPIVHEVRSRGLDPLVIHTGQHYSASMDAQIMADVGLSAPDHQIVRPPDCVSHAQQTAYMLTNLERILLAEQPDILLVCGDANTNLSGALAARKIHIKVGHVESGLRSYDWRMPEEHNRIIIDHISEYLFAPTQSTKENLVRDGVVGEVFVVGNTIVDATYRGVEQARQRVALGQGMKVPDGAFGLLTMHREENVDDRQVLAEVLRSVMALADGHDLPTLFPVHPRTRKRISEWGLEEELNTSRMLRLVEPLGYLDFLQCLSSARLVMTDSGGIQEESCILGIPCITLRESTERQETVAVGANRVCGTSASAIERSFREVMGTSDTNRWDNPYGDGRAAERIVDTCIYGNPRDEWQH